MDRRGPPPRDRGYGPPQRREPYARDGYDRGGYRGSRRGHSRYVLFC